MFGTCVYFFLKSWTYVRKINFLIWTKIKLYPFVALHLNTHPFYSLTVWPNPYTPKSPSMPWSIHGSAELHCHRSMFEDPAQDRAWFAADPALQDPGSNLTFTFFVNGFWFLFFVFVFRHQSGKPIFPVLCLLLRWSFDLQSKHRCPTL